MTTYRFEFEATICQLATLEVVAKNEKEAWKKFKNHEYDNWEDGEQLSCDIDFESAICEGYWKNGIFIRNEEN